MNYKCFAATLTACWRRRGCNSGCKVSHNFLFDNGFCKNSSNLHLPVYQLRKICYLCKLLRSVRPKRIEVMTPQRVLIVNKFYYRRGGDCIHALGLERMLRDRGHDVAVLSTAHPSNRPSEWSGYWPEAVDFADGSRMKAAARMLGFDGSARCVRRLLRDFRPDVVNLHNIHSTLSPMVAREAHSAGCRVVWTLPE